MVQDVVLPLQRLNGFPGVSGFEPVEFTIPELSDIVTAIAQNTLDGSDIGAAITNEIRAGNLPSPDTISSGIDRAISSIVADVTDELSSVEQSLAGDLSDGFSGLEAGLADVQQNLAADVEAIVGTVSEEFDGLADLIESEVLPAVSGVEDTLTDTVADVRENVETAIEQSTDEIDEQLGGVSGALATLGDTLGNVQQDVEQTAEDVSQLADSLPDSFETVVQEAVLGIEPTVDGSGLFSEPVAFAGSLIEQGLERAVSEETRERLRNVGS
jgi:archaellum component FlaC